MDMYLPVGANSFASVSATLVPVALAVTSLAFGATRAKVAFKRWHHSTGREQEKAEDAADSATTAAPDVSRWHASLAVTVSAFAICASALRPLLSAWADLSGRHSPWDAVDRCAAHDSTSPLAAVWHAGIPGECPERLGQRRPTPSCALPFCHKSCVLTLTYAPTSPQGCLEFWHWPSARIWQAPRLDSCGHFKSSPCLAR